MKRFLLFVTAIIIAAIGAEAQKITTVDTDGNVIPLVSVMTENGALIGTTDLHGVLANVKGAKKVAVSHVAFKPQVVEIASLQDGRIVMEDVDYSLSEIVAKPKPYLYMEYYFRAFDYIEDSLRVYCAGIMPVAHDIQDKYKGKVKGMWSYGGAANKALGWNVTSLEYFAEKVAKQATTAIQNTASKNEKFIDYFKTTVEQVDDKHWVIKNPEGILGHFHHDDGLYRATLDGGKLQLYANKAHDEKRRAKIKEDRDYDYQYSEVFKLDEDGNIQHENFIMEMNRWEYNSKKGRKIFIIYLYATDKGYMDEDEFKARAKEWSKGRDGNMSLEELAEYAQSHNIPPLSPVQIATIKALKKKTGEK